MAIGYRQLLRDNRDFRNFWLAEVVSFAGDWFNTIALYTAVAKLSSSTEALTGVFVAKMLPIFLVSPIAGPIVDRFDRRTLMVISDVARAVCALGLVLAYRLESIELLFALVLVMVCFTGLFFPAKSAAIPQLVPPEHLGAANALSGATWSAMLALGAATGGLVTALVGVEPALVIDALTFLVSLLFLLRLPRLLPTEDERGRDEDAEPVSVRAAKRGRGFVEGLRYLARRPYLAAIILIKPCMALTGGGAALLPVFGTRVFAGVTGAGFIGLLYTARGVGAVIGSLGLRRIFGDDPRTLKRMIVPLYLVIAASYAGLSVAPNIAWAAVCYVCTTIGGAGLWVMSGTLGQLESDNEYRGRVFAIEIGTHTLVLSIAAAGAGMLVDRAGWSPRYVTAVSALAMVVPVVMWTLAVLTRREPQSQSLGSKP